MLVPVGSTGLVCAIDAAYQKANEEYGPHPTEYQQGLLDGLDIAEQITWELITNMQEWCNERRNATTVTTLGDVQRYLANMTAHTGKLSQRGEES